MYPSLEALTAMILLWQPVTSPLLLHHAIHALAIGTVLFSARTDDKYREKGIKTMFPTTDIIQHKSIPHAGAVKDIMTAQLIVQDVPFSVFLTLNDFGFSIVKESTMKFDKINVAEIIIQNGEGPLDLPEEQHTVQITLYDNFGLKECSRETKS